MAHPLAGDVERSRVDGIRAEERGYIVSSPTKVFIDQETRVGRAEFARDISLDRGCIDFGKVNIHAKIGT